MNCKFLLCCIISKRMIKIKPQENKPNHKQHNAVMYECIFCNTHSTDQFVVKGLALSNPV